MNDSERDLLTQEEIDALLAEVEATVDPAGQLDSAEREALAELLGAVAEAAAAHLGLPELTGEPQVTVLTAADAAGPLAGGGLLVQVQRPCAAVLAVLLEGAELPGGAEVTVASAAVAEALSAVVAVPVRLRLRAADTVDPAQAWTVTGETPFVAGWWSLGGGQGARLGVMAPLAELRELLDAQEEAEPDERPVPGRGGRTAAAVDYPELGDVTGAAERASIELLYDVPLEITAVLGRTRRQVGQVLTLAPGSVIELDKLAGEPVEVLVNGKLIARGEVVVIDEHFGVRITDIVSRAERLRQLR